MKELTEFGERVVTLNTGAKGLRGGICCEVKDLGDGVMDFVASDATLDRYNEVVKPEGWLLDNFRKNPVIPDCHDYSSIARILGRAPSVGVTEGKLRNRIEFCLVNPMGNLAYKMAKGGFIKSESVGFIPLEWTNGVGKDMPDRTYTKQELLEISLVVVPANPGATIGLALKSGAIERRDLRDLREWLTTLNLEPRTLNLEQGKEEFCGDESGTGDDNGALVSGSNDAQWLQLGKAAEWLLKK